MAEVLTRGDALGELERLGVKGNEIYLLDAIPLIEMAWADGVVQPSERHLILEFVEHHLSRLQEEAGRPLISRADALHFISRFMEVRPTPKEFEELRRLLVTVRLTDSAGPQRAQRILDGVVHVGAVAAVPNNRDFTWDQEELFTLFAIEDTLSLR